MQQSGIELEIKVPNETRYLSLIGRIGEDIARELDRFTGDRDVLAYQLNLVLTEAMTNAIKYGNPGDKDDTVHISINILENSLQIKIYDCGHGFDINGVSPPDFEKLDDTGRGIFLIRSVMDSVKYEKNKSGNILEMIKLLC